MPVRAATAAARPGRLVSRGRLRQTPAVHRRPRVPVLLAAVLCAGASVADAPPRPDTRPRLELSLGVLDAFDGPRPGATGVEYRWPPLGRWSLAPGAGLLAGADGSRYAYADLSRRFALGPAWFATIVFGAGYFHDGSVVQLGHELMFRSGLEIGRALDDRWRVGLAIEHLSNGSLADHNPGTEIVSLRLSTALGRADQPAVAASPAAPPDGAPVAASWRSSSRRISSPASAR